MNYMREKRPPNRNGIVASSHMHFVEHINFTLPLYAQVYYMCVWIPECVTHMRTKFAIQSIKEDLLCEYTPMPYRCAFAIVGGTCADDTLP